jgi:lysyl-tRNA synthetase class 1
MWDLSRIVTGNRPDIAYARLAIDAYIDVIGYKVYFNEAQAEDFVQRALSLAIQINDKARTAKAKKALFDLYALVGDIEHRGLWSMLFDNLYGVRKANVTALEEQRIIDELERVLRLTSDQTNKEKFDPFAAQGAAERLERHYRRTNQPDEVHRVIRTYGQAFEDAAKEAAPLLAVAWLQPVFEKYQDAGLREDAARLHQILEMRGPQAQAGMQRIEIPIQISPEDIEKYAEALTAGDLRQSLGQIGVSFIPQIAEIQAHNQQMRSHAPLSTMIPIRRFEAGHVAAIIGSQAEDSDGRLVNQIATRIGFETPWLATAFEKLKARHGLDAAQIWAVLAESPLFRDDQRAVVVDGLAAWLGGDHIKAIHVLVPQVERTARNLAGLIGVPITSRGHTKGTMQIRGLGEILYDDLFAQLVEENLRKYLLAFLVDQRGINLRNRVAHGLLDQPHMHQGLSDRLVQVLLALSCLQPQENHGPTAEPASQ